MREEPNIIENVITDSPDRERLSFRALALFARHSPREIRRLILKALAWIVITGFPAICFWLDFLANLA